MRSFPAIRFVLLAAACAVMPLSVAHGAPEKPAPKGAPSRNHAPPAIVVPKGWPRYVLIPKIKVKAQVEALDLSKKLPQQAPYRWGDVAWYDRGPKPGGIGRAAVFGHVDSTCCPAVFWELKQLKPGDVTEVQYKTGKPIRFRVIWSKSYENQKMPIKFLFGQSKSRQRAILLVTCAGVFHSGGAGYDHKLVVYGRMILPNGKLG